ALAATTSRSGRLPSRRCALLRQSGGVLLDRFTSRVEKLEFEISRRLRLQRIVDNDAISRVPADSRRWRQRKSATSGHAITLFRFEELRVLHRIKAARVDDLMQQWRRPGSR